MTSHATVLDWPAWSFVWKATPIDYAAIERLLADGPRLLNEGDWIIWRANGQQMAGQVLRRRRSADYEVLLLNSEYHTHIVIVQGYEIVNRKPSHLEVLAASA
jgi:hypothetical protein